MWWKRVQSLQQDKIMFTNFNIHVDKSLVFKHDTYGRIKTEMMVKAVLFVSAVDFRVYVEEEGHVAFFVWYAFKIYTEQPK